MPDQAGPLGPLVIIGKPDVVMGFKALGFAVCASDDDAQSAEYLHATVAAGAAICLVQDTVYQAHHDIIDAYKHLPLPVFIPFSDKDRTALLDQMVRDIRLKATGAL